MNNIHSMKGFQTHTYTCEVSKVISLCEYGSIGYSHRYVGNVICPQKKALRW